MCYVLRLETLDCMMHTVMVYVMEDALLLRASDDSLYFEIPVLELNKFVYM